MTPPELNTGDSTVQTKVLNLLQACIECGVDGFCFDNAKHIELPSDDSSFASQFWPTVIGGAKDYASTQGFEEPFFYGEILGAAGPNFSISNYTDYMAVTDNVTGDRALDSAFWTDASGLADDTYIKGAAADKSVLSVESYETYMGNAGTCTNSNTKDIPYDVLNKAWAIVGARSLYSAPVPSPTPVPTPVLTPVPSSGPGPATYTIYAINNANWSKVNVHYWGDGETDWPGKSMTSISGNKVYTCDISKKRVRYRIYKRSLVQHKANR